MITHFSILAWRVPWAEESDFHGQRGLAGYSPQGRKESDMAERLTLSLRLSQPHFSLSAFRSSTVLKNLCVLDLSTRLLSHREQDLIELKLLLRVVCSQVPRLSL